MKMQAGRLCSWRCKVYDPAAAMMSVVGAAKENRDECFRLCCPIRH